MPRGWALLSLFWASVAGVAVATVGVLAVLGPPRTRVAALTAAPHAARTAVSGLAQTSVPRAAPAATTREAQTSTPRVAQSSIPRGAQAPTPRAAQSSIPRSAQAPTPRAAQASTPRSALAQPRAEAPNAAPTAIATADPSLLIESGDEPGRMLPTIAPDGRRSATVYAAVIPAVLPGQARLALVLDGIGLDHQDSLGAIRDLPAPVSLAVSPYAEDLATLVAEARRRGHEVLVSLPMEPENSAVADEGDHAIRPDATDADNARNLEWALSAAAGIVGATGADASGDGAHMAAATVLFRHDVAETLAADGLIYVAPEAEPPPSVRGLPVAAADLSIEAGLAPDALGRKLEALADDAIRTGAAVGTLGPPIPATTARLEAFLRILPARGIVLVPASALAVAPASEEAAR